MTASLPGMWERTVTIGSAGKTFSATGWKVSWSNSTGFVFCNINCLYLSLCLWLAGTASAVDYFRLSLFLVITLLYFNVGGLGNGIRAYPKALKNRPSELSVPLCYSCPGKTMLLCFKYKVCVIFFSVDWQCQLLFLKEAVAVGFQREYDLFGTEDSYFLQLPLHLHEKRLRLADCLKSVGLKPILPQGGYFMIADISKLSK